MLPGVGDGLKTVKGMALPFAFLYRKLAKEFTVYAFSRRRVLTPGLTTREMAEDLNSAMEALGLSAAALVGVSQGGMIAQWLAIDHPEKVDRSFEKGVANAMEILTRALQAEAALSGFWTRRGSGSAPALLKETAFTVSGIFSNPDHVTDKVSYSYYVIADKEAFDDELLEGCFPRVRVKLADMPDNYFSKDYMKLDQAQATLQAVDALIDQGYDGAAGQLPHPSPEDIARIKAEIAERYDVDTSAIPDTIIDDFANSGKEEVARWIKDHTGVTDMEKEYEAGLERYKAGLSEYEQGRLNYYYSGEQYLDGLISYEKGKKAIEEAEVQLKELYDARDLLEEKKEELAAGQRKLEEKRTELEDGKRELEEKRIELEDGHRELEEKRAELEDGKRKAAEGRAELEEKRREYDEGLQKYEEYRRTLDNARDMLSQLENGTWIVRNNRGDVCFVYSDGNSSNLASLSGTFSLLFIVIAALVIYASVGRMVDEQSTLVGTTKALGLLRREILLKYMIFGVLGTMLGVLLGILIAYFILEPLILNMYAPYYLVPKAKSCFLLGPTLIVVFGGLLLAVLSVYFASNRLLKMTAVQLMNGTGAEQKKEKEGKKEKKKKADDGEGSMMPGLILRNMSTDLRRVVVTIVSIMGCCTLLVVGFTMKYGQERVTDRQYGNVMSFDAELEYAPGTPDAEAKLAGVLDNMGISYIKVRKSANAYTWKEELSGANLVCAEPDSLPGYWNLTDAKTKKELRLPEHGVVITKRMHENFGMETGDTITLFDSNMFPHEAVISGVYDNYFGRTVFVPSEAYREIFGEAAEPNCFYVRLNGQEASALNAAVREIDGFLILTDAAKDRAQIEQTAKALHALILLMIIVAGLMAFFILFNLSGSYMIHKKRELTVMRINGFTTKETKNYASTELIIMTIAWRKQSTFRLFSPQNDTFCGERFFESFSRCSLQ